VSRIWCRFLFATEPRQEDVGGYEAVYFVIGRINIFSLRFGLFHPRVIKQWRLQFSGRIIKTLLPEFKFWSLFRYLRSVLKTRFRQINVLCPAHTHTHTYTFSTTPAPNDRTSSLKRYFFLLKFGRHPFRISVLKPVALTFTFMAYPPPPTPQKIRKFQGNYLKLGHNGLSQDPYLWPYPQYFTDSFNK
jgi:hypothetical protein